MYVTLQHCLKRGILISDNQFWGTHDLHWCQIAYISVQWFYKRGRHWLWRTFIGSNLNSFIQTREVFPPPKDIKPCIKSWLNCTENAYFCSDRGQLPGQPGKSDYSSCNSCGFIETAAPSNATLLSHFKAPFAHFNHSRSCCRGEKIHWYVIA